MNTIIENSKGEHLSVQVEGLENKEAKHLVFIEHGLASCKEYYVIRRIAEAFLANNYIVVTFDTRHSFGKSSGNVELSSLTTAYEDLQTIILWAQTQEFYKEPFALSGHSLGGGCVLKYAEDYPQKVNRLIPVSPMVGGKYYLRSYAMYNYDLLEKWFITGFRHCRKFDDRNIDGYVSYNFVKDLQNYDFVASATNISSPTLLITGSWDKSSTVYNNERLFENINAPKKMEIINNCTHVFESKNNQKELYAAIDIWLKDLSD